MTSIDNVRISASDRHLPEIAESIGAGLPEVNAVARLLHDGATIPFVARYRKEATGGLDEVAITAIRDQLHQKAQLDDRRATIIKQLHQHGHWTESIDQRLQAARSLSVLEDIYLPYRPKRQTRGKRAADAGLTPLADRLWEQTGVDPESAALEYLKADVGLETVDDALAGARDILAERINEDAGIRERLRRLFMSDSVCTCRVVSGKEEEAAKYRDYFDYSEPAARAPSHRVLAIRRGEREDVLDVRITPDEHLAIALITDRVVTGTGPDADQVRLSAIDAYRRLLRRSMETEIRVRLKDRADADAITVFCDNLRQLLMAPPMGARRTLAIDPGFRTGCKIACLDRQGALVAHDTIYPHSGAKAKQQAMMQIDRYCREYRIEAIAIGNGTASRETEAFIREVELPDVTIIVLVDESGASIYSASETARDEFPDLDLTFRGSASIGRRLMDPLAELVKIPPESIGVGQYQHDVDANRLKAALDDVVVSCVNQVGVDVNRASAELLAYVSGIGSNLSRKIVDFRNQNGPFATRDGLLDVPRLGPKAFEQAAGFLRIADGVNVLDATAVHPESYSIVGAMAGDLDCTIAEMIHDSNRRKAIVPDRYISETVGLPTISQILEELEKPGRDPRKAFVMVTFDPTVREIRDLKVGQRLPGVVTNVTAFGAFVDIGVHQDGLVHISQLADRFVKTPGDVVSVRQSVTVRVLSIDVDRGRISLSMKSPDETRPPKSQSTPKRRQRKNTPQSPKPSSALGEALLGALASGKKRPVS